MTNEGRHHRPRRRGRLRWAAAAAVLMVAFALLPEASAGFVSTSAAGSSSFRSGTVVISAAAPAGKIVAVTNAIPGSTGTTCVVTTYTGTLPATVRMYVPASSGTLGNYLISRIQVGTGSATDCSDFALASTLYNGSGALTSSTFSLTSFISAHPTYATGVGSWAATTNATRTWKFEWILPGNDLAQGLTVTFTPTWEAQS